MTRIRFDKYEALGNDFVVLSHDDPDSYSVERAQTLCDRHFGIGADGVLLVSPPTAPAARTRMTVYNADGSRPEMCGNGLRCVVLHVARTCEESSGEFSVQTDAGILSCRVDREGSQGRVFTRLGRGRLEEGLTATSAGREWQFARVSMGNPHAIWFGDPVELDRIDVVGPEVSAHIPGGSNVEFATQRGPRELDLVVWERGVGRTLACGTGAAATAVAAVTAGHCPSDEPLTVRLPGGPLEITVARETLAVDLCGPARWVFSGETEVP